MIVVVISTIIIIIIISAILNYSTSVQLAGGPGSIID